MVERGVPVKVGMQYRAQVEAVLLSCAPRIEPRAIESQQRRILVPELLFVVVQKVSESFGDLEAGLHAHRPFRQRANQRFKRYFRPVSSLVVVVIRTDRSEEHTSELQS